MFFKRANLIAAMVAGISVSGVIALTAADPAEAQRERAERERPRDWRSDRHQPRQPNLMVIIADDLGVDWMRRYGADRAEVPHTPNLDHLADRGVSFRNMWSAPNCSATRAHIISGQFGRRTGILNVVGPGFAPELDVTMPNLLPRRLAGLGYTTFFTGKYQLNWNSRGSSEYDLPVRAGYQVVRAATMGSFFPDRSYGPDTADGTEYFQPILANNRFFNCREGEVADASNPNCWRVEEINDPPLEIGEFDNDRYATTWQANEIIDFIDNHDPQAPWFINFSAHAPHAPFVLPPEHLVEPRIVDLYEATCEPWADGRREIATLDPTVDDACARIAYGAMISALDTEIGRVFEHIDWDNTVVVFVGDNGTPATVVPFVENPPFDLASEAKSSYYVGGVNVPFFVYTPDVQSGGRFTNALTSTTDIYSTFLDYAGADPNDTPATIDGVSFRRVMERRNPYLSHRRTTYSEIQILNQNVNPTFPGFGGPTGAYEGAVIRDERYSLVYATQFAGPRDGDNQYFPTGPFACQEDPQPTADNPAPCRDLERVKGFEFYDMRHDPFQQVDLLERGLNPRERRAFRALSLELLGFLEEASSE